MNGLTRDIRLEQPAMMGLIFAQLRRGPGDPTHRRLGDIPGIGGTTAQVVQAASKRAIAAGESSGGGTFVCDGSTVNPLDITVVSQTVPFRKGTAVVGVQLHICNADCSGFGYRSTGPILVTLTSK